MTDFDRLERECLLVWGVCILAAEGKKTGYAARAKHSPCYLCSDYVRPRSETLSTKQGRYAGHEKSCN
jgi:hypothetical protein